MNNRRKNRATAILCLEALDERIVPSTMGAAIPAPEVVSPVYIPNGSSLDKAGQTLNVVYSDYYSYYMGGSQGKFSAPQAGPVQINGTSVGVDIHVNGSMALVASELQGLGMKITATKASSGIIEGQLPIVHLPTIAGDIHVVSLSAVYKPVTNSSGGTPSSLAKAGQALTTVYQEYEVYSINGSPGTFTSSQAGRIQISGTSVGVDIHVNGSFALAVSRLQGLGMKITATSVTSGIIEGQLPISILPTVAGDSHVVSLSPIYKAIHN